MSNKKYTLKLTGEELKFVQDNIITIKETMYDSLYSVEGEDKEWVTNSLRNCRSVLSEIKRVLPKDGNKIKYWITWLWFHKVVRIVFRKGCEGCSRYSGNKNVDKGCWWICCKMNECEDEVGGV